MANDLIIVIPLRNVLPLITTKEYCEAVEPVVLENHRLGYISGHI